jgi:15-cis-phytoene synthase
VSTTLPRSDRDDRPDQVPPQVAQALATYDAVAEASAALVIESFSSSFGLASRLLGPSVRGEVRTIYALVRVADEVVDVPVPAEARARQRASLDALEAEVADAMTYGSSANLVVHAFARTARRCGITAELVTPFFASMRADLDVRVHDEASLAGVPGLRARPRAPVRRAGARRLPARRRVPEGQLRARPRRGHR